MKRISLVAIALLGASPAMANIVTNGSFEDLTRFPLANYAWGMSSALTGWTQGNGDQFEIQVAKNFLTPATGYYNSFNVAYDGAHYLELNANRLGEISQFLDTIAGQYYRLTFGYSGRSDSGYGNDSMADVYWGGVKVNPTILDEAPNSGWQTFNYTLTATGNSTELRFVSLGPTSRSSYGSLLDGISVNAIPEPETFALMLAGLGLLGFATHRQK